VPATWPVIDAGCPTPAVVAAAESACLRMRSSTTPYPGASPSAVETDVTQKIEEAINSTSGLSEQSSTSTEGMSLVIATYELEIDGDQAVDDINQKLSSILRDLPAGSRPEVKKAQSDSAPILVISVKGPAGLPIRDLTRFATKSVKQRIERINGVGQVILLGGQERQIEVQVDPIRLAAADTSALDVQRAIESSNVNVPGGRIESGPNNITLRVDARAMEASQIGEIVIRQNGDLPIRVRDVAKIVDSEEPAETAASRDGVPAVALSVRKQSDTNTVAVVDAVKAAVAEQRAELPAGYAVDIVRDNSEQIRTSTHQVLEHLIIGSLLAAFVVLLFLGSFRSTIIAAVSIPVSIIATFGLMMVAGFTLNMLTLLALALAVGIVIDDAIVVLENIHRFIHEKHMSPYQAAIEATKQIGPAVLATTLSLMAVFLPVAFMDGVVGRFLFSFGMTMAFAIGVSMLVAFTLTPLMSSRMFKPAPADGHAKPSRIERASNWVYKPLERWYGALLAFCLRRRWIVGLAIVGSCATLVPLKKQVGGDFLPINDEAQFEIYITAPESASLEMTTLISERLARKARTIPEVESTLVTVADGDQRLSNIGRVYVRLVDPKARKLHQNEVMDHARKAIAGEYPAGTRVAVQTVSDFSTGGQNATIATVITGPELDVLEKYGDQILTGMKSVPGVVDLDSTLVDPVKETTVTPNFERAAHLGVEPRDITGTLALLIGGVEVSTFEDRGDQYGVIVRAAEAFRTDPRALGQISVPSKTLGRVPLTDVITVSTNLAVSKITCQQRERAVIITMNVAPGYPDSVVTAALDKIVDGMQMKPGYRKDPYGTSKEMAKLQSAFMFAILLAIVFMYLVLAAQFESWLHPLTILLSLPLTVPFALLSLVLTNGSLNIFSMLGVIVLFAMVKKNSILQVDHTNVLRAEGMERNAAVLAANKDRLKPILMTTFAFVAGMIPLVTSKGIGSGFSKAMASVIVGGQTLSLLLTLVAIPVIYTWFDDLAVFCRRTVGRIRKPAIALQPATVWQRTV
jgi:hydrophobic/amphiphilic exporter-1 (mainly G- bacteria), HAE1 family